MNIDKIVNEIEKGNLVVTPTDTIYGIMGDALNKDVIKKVFQIKNRSYNKPLILLMSNYNMIKEYTKNIQPKEKQLIKEYMPGLVTIILEKNEKVNNLITANTNSVGVRIPDNKDLLEIITRLNRPVISTSANISLEKDITKITDLEPDIINNVSYIYDAGIINNKSSTIVRFTNNKLEILRHGELSQKLIEKFK